MILNTAELTKLGLRVRQVVRHSILLLLLLSLAAPATAHAKLLTKRHARAQALTFVSPFVDLADVNHTVRTVMVPPRDCLRVNRSTVACRFAFVLQPFGTVRGRVTIHRQRDGLLGFRVTPYLGRYWVG